MADKIKPNVRGCRMPRRYAKPYRKKPCIGLALALHPHTASPCMLVVIAYRDAARFYAHCPHCKEVVCEIRGIAAWCDCCRRMWPPERLVIGRRVMTTKRARNARRERALLVANRQDYS